MGFSDSIATGSCQCSIGYVCGCAGIKDYFSCNRKRPYTYNGKVLPPKGASDLMVKRLVREEAGPELLKKINAGCCKKKQCLKIMYEGGGVSEGSKVFSTLNAIPDGGHGAKFSDAVLAARTTVYVGDQNNAQMQLKLLLLRNQSSEILAANEYKFFHQGVLGNSPKVPSGIVVSTSHTKLQLPAYFRCFVDRYMLHQQVCQKAWQVIYGVSHQTTVQLVRSVGAGDLEHPKRQPKNSRKECKVDAIRNWLTGFFENIADRMPDDSNQHGRESWHLPSWMTKYWIHNRCLLYLNGRQSGEKSYCTGEYSIHYQ